MTFQLPPLPYDKGALAPHISAQTLEFHHGKHHQAYVTNLNNLLKDKPEAAAPLEDVIQGAAGNADKVGVFNNAAQIWNHSFFWNGMKPGGGGKPHGDVASMIDKAFGNHQAFVDQFKQAAITQFGSGWAWLVLDKGVMKITKTANADLPLAHGQVALLTVDVWEHAYYLDYQNRRPDFVQTFIDHLINWDFVAQNIEKAA